MAVKGLGGVFAGPSHCIHRNLTRPAGIQILRHLEASAGDEGGNRRQSADHHGCRSRLPDTGCHTVAQQESATRNFVDHEHRSIQQQQQSSRSNKDSSGAERVLNSKLNSSSYVRHDMARQDPQNTNDNPSILQLVHAAASC